MDPLQAAQEKNLPILLQMLESKANAIGKTYKVNGLLTPAGCNAIMSILPTCTTVYGLQGEGVPPWNAFDTAALPQIFSLARSCLDDVGMIILVASKSIASHLLLVCSEHGFCLDHSISVFCKTPYTTTSQRKVMLFLNLEVVSTNNLYF